MKTNHNEFNAKKGQALKDRGLAIAEANCSAWLGIARGFAMRYAKKHGEVTSDDVQRYCPRPIGVNHNAVGAVMRQPYLEHTGKHVLSSRVSAHRRVIGVFR